MSGGRGKLPAVVDTASAVMRPTLHNALAVPAMIANAGDRAARRFLDYFAASIENDNTRLAYHRGVCSFFAWLDEHGIGELPDIEPFHVAAYLKALRVADAGNAAASSRAASKPTVKQHLAAIRMLFDWLGARYGAPETFVRTTGGTPRQYESVCCRDRRFCAPLPERL